MLVTGGSRGIGRAIARAFAEQGDRVAVHWGSSRGRAEQVLAELPGDGHVLVQADLADAEAVRRDGGRRRRRGWAGSTCWSTTPASSPPTRR